MSWKSVQSYWYDFGVIISVFCLYYDFFSKDYFKFGSFFSPYILENFLTHVFITKCKLLTGSLLHIVLPYAINDKHIWESWILYL